MTAASHYHDPARGALWPALQALILEVLKTAGKTPAELVSADLAGLDEFHVRGREASLELLRAAGFSAGQQLLDLGCGLGGPARLLAENTGARVWGIDFTPAYCHTANHLSHWLKLGQRVCCLPANALALPFADASFDGAWSQHTAMNIADKERLYGEIHRVLRPGSRLAIYDVLDLAPEQGPLPHPLPWASTPAQSFLLTPTGLKQALAEAGFLLRHWEDSTAAGLAALDKLRQRLSRGLPPLGLHLLVGNAFPQMAAHLAESLSKGRLALIQLVAEKATPTALPPQALDS